MIDARWHSVPDQLPAVADLFGDLEVEQHAHWRDYVPGLLVTTVAVLAAAFLSEHYGAPLTLIGLLMGMALNFLSGDRRLAPGLALAAGSLLRIGIVLIGLRVTLGQIVELGPEALIAVMIIAAGTMAAGIVSARLLGLGTTYGVLAGGAVAICGASAALALAAILARQAGKAQLAIVLVGIAVMSAAAMSTYPVIAHNLGLAPRQAGFFLGAAIHDVAQALGAGYSFSEAAGQTATIVKLARVALLAPVLALVGMWVGRNGGKKSAARGVPWFVLGFLAAVAINSTGLVPATVSGGLSSLGSLLVAVAVTAAGIRTPVSHLLECGVRSFLPIAVATLVAAMLALAAAMLLF